MNYNISNSKILKDIFFEYEGIKIDEVIYNGIDETIFYPNKISHKGFVIGTAIKFYYEDKVKGLYILIESFKEICKQNGEVFLKIAGEGPLQNDVNIFINSLDSEVKNKIMMAGEIPYNDMPKFYNSLDLYAQISFQDALSNSILEAMSCEVPVIANDIGDVKFVLDTEVGWMVEPKVEKLTSYISYLINIDDNILKEKGRQARKKIIDKFSLEKTIKSYLNLINTNCAHTNGDLS